MIITFDLIARAVLIGAGATAVMDLVAVARQRLSGATLPDYGLVGRWIAHMGRGRFRHQRIAASPPMPGERAIGWATHYLIGILFAALLLAIWGIEWASRPSIGPALIIGIGSVAAPFLLMQPAMGVGIASCHSPNPGAARLRSLTTHGTFAVGLYAAGWIASLLGL